MKQLKAPGQDQPWTAVIYAAASNSPLIIGPIATYHTSSGLHLNIRTQQILHVCQTYIGAGGCKHCQRGAAYQWLSPGMCVWLPGHAQPNSGHQPICCHSPVLLISLCVWSLRRAQVPLWCIPCPVHQCCHDAGPGTMISPLLHCA